MSTSFEVTPTTSKVLNNFGKIAEQVILTEGAIQKVKGPGKGGAILATAVLPEPWPQETAIFNFNRFLGTLSLFEKPRLTFGADSVTISNDVKSAAFTVKFKLSDSSTIDRVPQKTFPVDNPAVQFVLNEPVLSNLQKSASLLDLQQFTIIVTPEAVQIVAADPKNPNSHKFEFTIGDDLVTRLKDFETFKRTVRFRIEHFDLLLKGDYTVSIGEKWPYVYLQNKALPVTYYIAEDITK